MIKQSVEWISEQHSFEIACKCLQGSQIVGIDTEFVRRNTYYPIPALIQLSNHEKIFLIDPRSNIANWDELKKILESDQIIKVAHACREDIEVLFMLTNSIPKPIFDTQTAAFFLNISEQISYQDLVEQKLEIYLEKLHTLINWCRRPLSESEKKYASEDVAFLPLLYEILSNSNLKHLMLEESQFIAQQVTQSMHSDDLFVHLRWTHLSLSVEQALWLREILVWRQIQARNNNVIAKHLIDDETISKIVKSPNLLQLNEKLNKIVDKLTSEPFMQGKFKKMLCLDKIALQEKLSSPVPKNFPWGNSFDDSIFFRKNKHLIIQLTQQIQKVAEEKNIPASMIARKKNLIELVQYVRLKGRATPKLLQSWRKKTIGEKLLKIATEEIEQINIASGSQS